MTTTARHAGRPFGRGFTLIEASITLVLTSTLVLASLVAVGGSVKARVQHENATSGFNASHDLLNEILAQSYMHPGATPVFGLEAGESATTRIAWNDVDDYDGWTSSPPQRPDGTEITELEQWTRTVSVAWVYADTPGADAASDTGVKRIEVTTTSPNGHSVSAVALRTAAGAREHPPTLSGDYVMRTSIKIEIGADPANSTTVETSSTQVNHVRSTP